MPCETANLDDVRCNDANLQSETVQQNIWLQFLCLVALNINPAGGTCGIADLLVAAEAQVCHGKTARQKMIQAQIICDNLSVTCTQPICTKPDIIEAAKSILVCRIVNAIE